MNALDAIMGDPHAFISRLWIISKTGEMIKLVLNDEQKTMLDDLVAGYNVLVVKCRQIGSTTVSTAFAFWKAYVSKDPITCMSVLHKMDSASEIFLKYKGFYIGLPSLLQKSLVKETSSCLKFKNGASVNAVTAGGQGGLRSYTISFAHVSEFCYYEQPEELLATLLAALNGNQIIIESTCRSFGDPVHSLVDKIQRGELQGKWKMLFFPWQDHKEYSYHAVPDDFIKTVEEERLAELYGLTNNQIYWRRLKIQEMGISKFNTEYPACLDDVFAQKGDCYYSNEDIQNVDVFSLPTNQEDHRIFEPDPQDKYAIGVDVASGRGKDYSVITVLSKKTGNPCYIYRSNEITPPSLARKIQHISVEYNDALTMIEENNWGLPVLNELRNLSFHNLWTNDEGGNWITTSTSKLMMFEDLKEAIRKGSISKLDYITISELKALVLNEKGLAPQSVRGATGHGDNVISLGLAWQCLKDVQAPLNAYNKFLVENKRHASVKRNNPFAPISRQY
jgi:hypothetical protein